MYSTLCRGGGGAGHCLQVPLDHRAVPPDPGVLGPGQEPRVQGVLRPSQVPASPDALCT